MQNLKFSPHATFEMYLKIPIIFKKSTYSLRTNTRYGHFSHKIREINENMILRGHRQKSVSTSTGIFLCKTAIKIGKMNITP